MTEVYLIDIGLAGKGGEKVDIRMERILIGNFE